MHHLIDEYLNYLSVEKGASRNTIDGYSRDLNRYAAFIGDLGIQDMREDRTGGIDFLSRPPEGGGLAANSVNRALAALRGFYKYLLRMKKVDSTPVAHIELAKVWMHLPDVLSREEMNLMLAQPGSATPAALRDAAMLELMYATGIRVSELIGLTVNSINWQVGYLVAMGKGGKERIVPVGKTAYDQVKRYIEGARPLLLKGRENDRLFLNRSGKGMTRQGFWKIVKKYAAKVNLGKKVHPHTLPALLCLPPAGGGGRPAFRADHAGSCRHLHNADLHACDSGTAEGDSPEIPSAGMRLIVQEQPG